MEFIRRFGLIVCAALVIIVAAAFLINLYSGDGAVEESVFGMDFAFGTDGDSSADLVWTIIAAAIAAFAGLALLTALVPNFGRRDAVIDEEVAEPERTVDTTRVESRMKETAESVDGVEHAETYAYARDGVVESGKIDLYLDEGRDPGRISDEVAERVRSLFTDEFEAEPSEGFEVDVHQPRKFFNKTTSDQTA